MFAIQTLLLTRFCITCNKLKIPQDSTFVPFIIQTYLIVKAWYKVNRLLTLWAFDPYRVNFIENVKPGPENQPEKLLTKIPNNTNNQLIGIDD